MHAPHKINTIAEDDVIGRVDNLLSPSDDDTDYAEFDQQIKSLPFMKSSPFVKLKALEEGDDDIESEPVLSHRKKKSKSLDLDQIKALSPGTIDDMRQMQRNQSSPHRIKAKTKHLAQINDSKSTPTKTPTPAQNIDINDRRYRNILVKLECRKEIAAFAKVF